MRQVIRQASGLFLALLALGVQLTLVAAVPVTTVLLADATTLCRHHGDHGGPAAPTHRGPDCQLCLVCHGALGPPGLLSATPVLPRPTTVHLVRAAVQPPPTVPPLRFVTASGPRGPPVPV